MLEAALMRTSFRHQSEAQPPNSPLTQRGEFVVTSPDIEPMKFKTRREARDWCAEHYPGSPIREIVPVRKRPTGEGTASGSG